MLNARKKINIIHEQIKRYKLRSNSNKIQIIEIG